MKQKVVIVGCGWLGKQLATHLVAAGFQVFGSRQRVEGFAELPAGTEPILLQLPLMAPSAQICEVLQDSWVICTIPPSARQQSAEQYALQLQNLVEIADAAGIRGMIHCSSTGVYHGLAGDVDENSPLSDHPRALLLAAAEQILQQLPNCITLRLAGLIGPGRNPARFGQGRALSGPELPVNLVHATDICRFVLFLLNKPMPIEHSVFNLCCPEHPKKVDFYHAAALAAGSPLATFVSADESARCVLSKRSEQVIDFNYQYQSPYQALGFCDE
jgi:nucleoside-diphosphate-sugar epimerase